MLFEGTLRMFIFLYGQNKTRICLHNLNITNQHLYNMQTKGNLFYLQLYFPYPENHSL